MVQVPDFDIGQTMAQFSTLPLKGCETMWK